MVISKKLYVIVGIAFFMQFSLLSPTPGEEFLDVLLNPEYDHDYFPENFTKEDLEKILASESEIIKEIEGITDVKKLKKIEENAYDSFDNSSNGRMKKELDSRRTLISTINELSENNQKKFFNIINILLAQVKKYIIEPVSGIFRYNPRMIEQVILIYPEIITADRIKKLVTSLQKINSEIQELIQELKFSMGNGDTSNLILYNNKKILTVYTTIWPQIEKLTPESSCNDMKKLYHDFFYTSNNIPLSLAEWEIKKEKSSDTESFDTLKIYDHYLIPLAQKYIRIHNILQILPFLAKTAHEKGINLDEAKKLAIHDGLTKIEKILEDAMHSKKKQ